AGRRSGAESDLRRNNLRIGTHRHVPERRRERLRPGMEPGAHLRRRAAGGGGGVFETQFRGRRHRTSAAPLPRVRSGRAPPPARMIPGALQDLASAVHDQAVAAGLAPADRFTREGNIETFATPRRLAVRVTGLRSRQADGAVEVTGPPARAAYDAEGRPTKAA